MKPYMHSVPFLQSCYIRHMERPKQSREEAMTEKDILRYLYLLDRRLYIIISSGSSWKPEYAHELEGIDRELAGLRELVSQEHGKRGQKGRRDGVAG